MARSNVEQITLLNQQSVGSSRQVCLIDRYTVQWSSSRLLRLSLLYNDPSKVFHMNAASKRVGTYANKIKL